MSQSDLSTLLPRFFTEHLVKQRNVSLHTIAAYRDTFRLFLRFLRGDRRTQPSELPLHAVSVSTVLAFLNHLESSRANSIRTRNARLAAIRSFVRYANDHLGPELPERTRRILALPRKRHPRPLLGFLGRDEVEAILRSTDDSWSGRRDHLFFLLLYNTGARVSELIRAQVDDVTASGVHHIHLHGKGRKDRMVPLWRTTQVQVRRWIKENGLAPDAPLLPNRFGRFLSRSGVAWQLRRLANKARGTCSSLRSRRISPHTFPRHATAMHFLQAGVAVELIALWLGHENPSTTHQYVEADLEMKKRTLASVEAPKARLRPKKLPDALLDFLEQL
jgi:site-specific recombinase XerD